MTTSPPARPTALVRRHRRRPLHHQVQADAARRHLPACHGDQLRHRRAEGRGREVRRRLRQASGRHRRLQARRMDARPALVFERNADYWNTGLPYLDKITFEIGQEPIVALLRLQKGEVDVPGDGIPPAKFQRGDERPGAEGARRRGRPAAHRLRHHERQHGALRQREGAPGRQHGDQQGPHRPDHQRPRDAGQPAAAAVDAGLRQGLQGLSPTTSAKAKALLAEAGHRRRLRDRALRHEHRSATRASPRRSSRIWRRSASRPPSSRWRRPT